MVNGEQERRRAEIRRLIRGRVVETQEHLGDLLKRAGFRVTQATLSRDLAKLGARRVSRPEGGTAYELAETLAAPAGDAFATVRKLVRQVDLSDALVVIRTAPGAAPAVALGIDQRRIPGVLATLAGDDTIFIAPQRGTSPEKVAKQLHEQWNQRGVS